MKIYCGIVTYNPKIDILKKNIESVYNQVDRVIIVDNASDNLNNIIDKILDDYDITLVSNARNLGIAAALNQIVSVTLKDNVKWVLTLDQDSVIPSNYISSFEDYTNENVGILCPRIYNVENNSEDLPSKDCSKIIEVSKCITSGSLLNVEAWETIGGFDEKLFIDNVDFDYCYRVRQAGYKIIKNQAVTIKHSLGERKNVKFLFFKKIISAHGAVRIYYICRNKLYCDYKIYNRFTIRSFASIMKIICNILIWEDEKANKLKYALKGIIDSFDLVKEYKNS